MINELMTTKFRSNTDFSGSHLKLNWHECLFIFQHEYIVISSLSCFERILQLWKEALLNDLLCDKPPLLGKCLVIYFKTAEEFYSNMSIDYPKFMDDLFAIVDYLLDKIKGMDNALIYGFSTLICKNANYLFLFPQDSLKFLIFKYFKLANGYLGKCISYFMGESEKMAIIKFNTFEFSETLEAILKYSHLFYKFMVTDKQFCQECEI
jgi:hypothetical protein